MTGPGDNFTSQIRPDEW